jgi:hypothetical protein
MAEQAEQVATDGLVDTKPPKRRQYSEALKRQMVAETQVRGASVSIVARRHDVNSNQLFRWRRQLLPKRRWSKVAPWCLLRSRLMAVDDGFTAFPRAAKIGKRFSRCNSPALTIRGRSSHGRA